MQSRSGGVILPAPPLLSPIGWLQAGLDSFAYRLAHLRAPRPLLVLGAALLFYIG